MFIDFDVTMATDLLQAFFSENEKSLFKMKKNKITFLTVTFMFLAHIGVALLVLITFRLI